jgi:hypothetical protein
LYSCLVSLAFAFYDESSVAYPDPGSGAFLTPGSGMGKNNQDSYPGSGSRMNNPDHIFESFKKPIFWVKIVKLLVADPVWEKLGSGMKKICIRDPG